MHGVLVDFKNKGILKLFCVFIILLANIAMDMEYKITYLNLSL